MGYEDEKNSQAIQRSLDRQEAEANRGLTPEEEEAMDARGQIDCQCGGIPQGLSESLERYVNHRVPPGSYLRAVLENDLSLAVSRADHQNFQILRETVHHVHSCLPGNCHGSKLAVRSWLGEKGSW